MGEQIKAGDLAMIVKPKLCGCNGALGYPFRVTKISKAWLPGHCFDCGKDTYPMGAVIAEGMSENGYPEIRRLKRIDPLSEPESTEHKQEQPA